MIKTYSDKAGIKKHITTHSLRHTFASDLLRDTKNIRIVQKALGHADISSTQIYTHIVDEELEEALKSFRSGNKQILIENQFYLSFLALDRMNDC